MKKKKEQKTVVGQLGDVQRNCRVRRMSNAHSSVRCSIVVSTLNCFVTLPFYLVIFSLLMCLWHFAFHRNLKWYTKSLVFIVLHRSTRKATVLRWNASNEGKKIWFFCYLKNYVQHNITTQLECKWVAAKVTDRRKTGSLKKNGREAGIDNTKCNKPLGWRMKRITNIVLKHTAQCIL